MSVKIIYPETRTVSNERIMQWAKDAFDNGETDEQATDVHHAVAILSDLGHITVPKDGIQ